MLVLVVLVAGNGHGLTGQADFQRYMRQFAFVAVIMRHGHHGADAANIVKGGGEFAGFFADVLFDGVRMTDITEADFQTFHSRSLSWLTCPAGHQYPAVFSGLALSAYTS